jgi:hypothetical protein
MKIKYTKKKFESICVSNRNSIKKTVNILNHFYMVIKILDFAASNVFKENNMPDVYSWTDKQRGYYILNYEDIKNNFNKLSLSKGEIKKRLV